MLTISNPIHPGQFDYYVGLAEADYYSSNQASPGRWIGTGCSSLGLSGDVERDQFRHLLAGFAPNDAQVSLVQNAGAEDRQGGIDMTFSAPKPFSVLWALAPDDLRRELNNAHWGAVETAFRKTEENYGFTRRGKAGGHLERTKLVAAAFDHKTSRAMDMQVHTHVVLLAISVRADGTTGTTYTKEIFRHKMELGAEYQKELINRVIQLGFEVELRDKSFTIVGVDPKIVSEFSKRRHAIERRLEDLGLSGAIAAKIAALDTRASKREIPLAELSQQWHQVAKELGWTDRTIEQIRRALTHDPALEKGKLINHDLTIGPSQIEAAPVPTPTVKPQPADERPGALISNPVVANDPGMNTPQNVKPVESSSTGETKQTKKRRSRRRRSRKAAARRNPRKKNKNRIRRARLDAKIARVRPFKKAPSWNPLSRMSVPFIKLYWRESSVLKKADKAKLKSALSKKGSAVTITGKSHGRSLEKFVTETKDFFKDQGLDVMVVTRDKTGARALRKKLDVRTITSFALLRELKTKKFSLSLASKRPFPKAPFPNVNPIASFKVPFVKFNHSPLRLKQSTVLVVSEAHKIWGRDLARLKYRARLAGARVVFLTDDREQDRKKAYDYDLKRERDRSSRSSEQQSQSQSQSQSR